MWTTKAVSFLSDLHQNNSRAWFQANKARYEADIKGPFAEGLQALADGLSARLGQPLGLKQFRINRDVRFSKDKTPYNCHVRATFFDPDVVDKGQMGLYFSFEHDGFSYGCGALGFPNLERWRHAVVGEPGEALHKIVADFEDQGFTRFEPDLKRVPRGFDPDHVRGGLLKHKGFGLMHSLRPHPVWLLEDGQIDRLCQRFEPLWALQTWLATHCYR